MRRLKDAETNRLSQEKIETNLLKLIDFGLATPFKLLGFYGCSGVHWHDVEMLSRIME